MSKNVLYSKEQIAKTTSPVRESKKVIRGKSDATSTLGILGLIFNNMAVRPKEAANVSQVGVAFSRGYPELQNGHHNRSVKAGHLYRSMESPSLSRYLFLL